MSDKRVSHMPTHHGYIHANRHFDNLFTRGLFSLMRLIPLDLSYLRWSIREAEVTIGLHRG